jgi:hypothetical protein
MSKLIEHVFDLKGSRKNREVTSDNIKNTSTLKDLNLLKIKLDKPKMLRFIKEDREKILDLLSDDVEILTKFNLMDYSLLFCLEKTGQSPNSERETAPSENDYLNLPLREN